MPRLSLARRVAYGVDRLLVEARWQRSLTAQFGPLVAESVLARAWRDYLVRLAALPPGSREGSRLVQRWTALAIALYR
ncbi:MAG TPA: hypothetical protein VH328_16895, partial [Burkholderiaceae bacterium]|nr:hypothetical protein [Burkholderiaceae bacterium]